MTQLLTLVTRIHQLEGLDNVSSWNSTERSKQVTEFIAQEYRNIVADKNTNVRELKKIRQLGSVGDVTRPTHLLIPSNVQRILYFKYNNSTTSQLKMEELTYYPPDEFVEKVQERDNTGTDIDEVVINQVTLPIRNNIRPSFWTTFSDEYVIADAYNSSIESTLQQSNTTIYCVETPDFTYSNTWEIPLDDDMINYLTNKTRYKVKRELKGIDDRQLKRDINQGQLELFNDKMIIAPARTYTAYGRKIR